MLSALAHLDLSPTPLTGGGIPVGYAIDPKRVLSSTPSTPIEPVGGVGDRFFVLSVASVTG